MAKVIAKCEVKIPSILMDKDEALTLKPIKHVTSIGKATIHPPGTEQRKPKSYVVPKRKIGAIKVESEGIEQLWDADTIWIDVEIEKASTLSEREMKSMIDSEVSKLVYRFLRLIRQKLPETPISLPTSLDFGVSFDWGPQPPKSQHVTATLPFAFKVVSPEAPLTKEKWIKLGNEIKSGFDTELWEDFLIDAKVALDEEDLNRATIYTAIGCEIFIKEYTEKAAKEKGVSEIFWEYLNNPNTETRVLTYYDQVLHLVKGHSMKKENAENYNRLKRIFSARNKIMHTGKIPPSWNSDRIRQHQEDIKQVEQTISWVRGL